jgi:hypothetical protein
MLYTIIDNFDDLGEEPEYHFNVEASSAEEALDKVFGEGRPYSYDWEEQEGFVTPAD